MTSQPNTSLIHPDSLGDTLDSINLALFDGCALSTDERNGAALWLTDRQGLPGAYAGMFAPTEYDYAFGTQTFTGEAVRSAAATGHILGEEACGALYRLGVATPQTQAALKRARQGIFKRIEQSEAQGQWSGVYCCGTCTVALWRHLSASDEEEDHRRIENGLAELRHNRDGEGRWRRFPFYYTLYALADIDHPAVQGEIHYAMRVIERAQRRLQKQAQQKQAASEQDRRRRMVLERILEKS